MSDISSFKKLIQRMETGNSPDAIHPTMEEGMHEGMAAQGSMGVMPLTLQLAAKRKVRDGSGSELDKIIADADPTDIPALLQSNPHKYDEYASELAQRTLQESGGNPEQAYMRWNQGLNLGDNQIKQAIKTHPEMMSRLKENMGGLTSGPMELTDTLPKLNKDVLFSKLRKSIGR